MKLVYKDIKMVMMTIFYIFKKAEQSISMLRRDMERIFP